MLLESESATNRCADAGFEFGKTAWLIKSNAAELETNRTAEMKSFEISPRAVSDRHHPFLQNLMQAYVARAVGALNSDFLTQIYPFKRRFESVIRIDRFVQLPKCRFPNYFAISNRQTPRRILIFLQFSSYGLTKTLSQNTNLYLHSTSVGEWAPRGGAVNRVRPEIWSSPKRGTLVRSPLPDRRFSLAT